MSTSPGTRGLRTSVVLLFALSVLACSGATAQTLDARLWETNGPVHATLVSGNTLYIGGTFTYVGPHTGMGVALDPSTGAIAPPHPEVGGGPVYAGVADGAGGWYLGGAFTRVGGLARAGLAHVLADGSVDGWNPGADGPVRALALAGGTLYAGGEFTHVASEARGRLAAFDLSTGLTTGWDPGADGAVLALAVSGGTLYAGGWFATTGGQPRSRIAALDRATGLATAWDPAADGAVHALAVSGATVYAGGEFATVGGQARARIAALDEATGLATGWDPGAAETVQQLVATGSRVYVGGHWGVSALDPASGAAAWTSPLDGVRALSVGGGTVYAGGCWYDWSDGRCNGYVVGMTADAGTRLFTTGVNDSVLALDASGDRVYAGGAFTSVGGVGRSYVAAIDLATGQPTAWNPALKPSWLGAVYALAAAGDLVYAGGAFEMGTLGQPSFRRNLVALDRTTGEPTGWNPKPGGLNATVYALALSTDVIYVGGVFTSCGGSSRTCIGAVDLATGLATSWYPPGGTQEVHALALAGNTLYVGGFYSRIGGMDRGSLAAVDATTGAVTSWNPSPSIASTDYVGALAVAGNTVYVGGNFTATTRMIGGQPRDRLAAVDATTGLATGWDPDPDQLVNALLPLGAGVYAGGGFTSIGGASGSALASLDAATGLATPWAPGVISVPTFAYPRDLIVHALAATPSALYVGGDFESVCGQDRQYLAGLSIDLPTPVLVSLVSARAEPGRVRLAWHAADAGLVATLYRRTADTGWQSLGTLAPSAEGALSFDDAEVAAGTRYGYRLGVRDGGAETFLGEAWVDVPAVSFALAGLRPNPAARGLAIAFTLPDATPARLTVLDVAGRALFARDVGALGPGSHVLDAAEGRPVSPGMVLVRLTRGDRTLTSRGVVIR